MLQILFNFAPAMRTFILFFIRYYSIFFFFFLESLSVYMMVQNKSYHRAAYFTSANYLTGNIYRIKNDIAEYAGLQKVNDALAAENAWLKTELRNNLEIDFKKRDTVFSEEKKQHYIFVAAKIINNSVNKSNNYFTLDKGRKDGMEQQMGVIGEDGVAGIVKEVSENFSSCLSLLHKDIRISAKLKKNGYFGSLAWTGFDAREATLAEIPKHAPVENGDTIVTSGYSDMFPENILIGTIEHVELQEGDNFYKIKVRLSTDFHHLNYVYAVKNILHEEKTTLEETSQKN